MSLFRPRPSSFIAPLLWIAVLTALLPACSKAINFSNFETPESVQVDPETGARFVSNVSGDPFTKDGNGFISKVSANGNIVIQKYIGGKSGHPVLHAPKGLLINGKNIFVTDIDTVKAFDKETGKQVAAIDFSEWKVKFLNDITMDASGQMYVSDMLTDRIFKIDPKKDYEIRLFKEGKELGNPNGLIVNPHSRNLMVVTWETGQILEIDPSGKVHVLKKGLKKLDGIDYDVEGNLYVSSFEKGEVYRIPFYGRGALSIFLGGLRSPADISCDRKKYELLVPSFNGNTVDSYPLKAKKQKPSSNLPAVKK